jgi:hypothetical protein
MTEEYEQFARFNSEIKDHAVTVLRDDGLYRHLRCAKRGTYCGSFDIITWPGHLCYAGDMGCYVFTRLKDMFEFFRGRETAVIDRGYLAEKAVADDRHGGIREYSEELFRAAVKLRFDEFVENDTLPADEAADLWREIEDDVLSSSDNHHDAVDAAMNFRWAPDGDRRGREVFADFYEHRLEEYTCRFWWCCYAIPWAIARYDAMREQSQAVDAVVTQGSLSNADA